MNFSFLSCAFILTSSGLLCFVSGSLGELVGRTVITALIRKPKFAKEIGRFAKVYPQPQLFRRHLKAILLFINDKPYSAEYQIDCELGSEDDRMVYAIHAITRDSRLALKAYNPKGHLLYVNYWPQYPGAVGSTILLLE